MEKFLGNKQVFSWALYDWANSAFSTAIIAGFFPVLYSSLTADMETRDSQFWFNMTLAVSSLVVAVLAPVLGAIADHGGQRKKFLATFALLGILMSASLAWVGTSMWWLGLIIYGLGQVGFFGANIFYDALIVVVSTDDDMDVVSGLGYALGYIGGGLLFLFDVLLVTQPQWFSIPDQATALSFAFISVALWWAVFTVPLLVNVKDSVPVQTTSVLESIQSSLFKLKQTFSEIGKYRQILFFLGGYWLYIDGVGTIIKMAVFFADRVLSLPSESLIMALLVTQFVAFPAALFFGWLGKKIGPKQGILTGLAVYTVVVLFAWKGLQTEKDFFVLAIAIGLVQGGVQSLSRSLFARIIPRSKTTEFFGFYNMVGKFASIIGPILLAVVPFIFAGSSERDSVLVLVLLFVFGGYLLYRVDVEQGIKDARV